MINDILTLARQNRINFVCSIKPIFIVGASRAGTTWLQSLLSLHPWIFTIPETKLFQQVLDSHKVLTFSELYPQQKKPVPFLISKRQLEISFNHLDAIGFIKLSAHIRNFLMSLAEKNLLDVCLLLNLIMYNAGNSKENIVNKFWVEKTPRHIFFLEDIFHYFPNARVICIYRDLIDQAYSGYRTFGYPIIEGLIDGFKSYNSIDKYIKAHPDDELKIFRVTYEELKADPKQILNNIFRFLGILPLDLSNEELKKLSQKSFLNIYANTSMTSWQPKMKNFDHVGQDKVLFEKYTYMLSLLFRNKTKSLIRPRQYSYSDFFSIKFILFGIKHFFLYALFLFKTKVKEIAILLSRHLKKLG